MQISFIQDLIAEDAFLPSKNKQFFTFSITFGSKSSRNFFPLRVFGFLKVNLIFVIRYFGISLGITHLILSKLIFPENCVFFIYKEKNVKQIKMNLEFAQGLRTLNSWGLETISSFVRNSALPIGFLKIFEKSPLSTFT